MRDKFEVADAIRNAKDWNKDDCRELCELAGIKDKWDAADDKTFKQVVYEAAYILLMPVIQFTPESYRAYSDVKKKNEYNKWHGGDSFYSGHSRKKAWECYPYSDWNDVKGGSFNEELTEAGLPPINFTGRISLDDDNFPDEDFWSENGYESLEDAHEAFEKILEKFVDETDDYLSKLETISLVVPYDVRDDLETLTGYASWDGPRDIEEAWISIDFDRKALADLLEEAPDAEEEYWDEKARSGELDS